MNASDWQPCFAGSDASVDDRWQQLFRFVSRWSIPRDPPLTSDRIQEIPESLEGHHLPKSVRYWQLTDARPGRDDLAIRYRDAHDVIQIMSEGDGGFFWAVRVEHLNQDDPPVYLIEEDWYAADTGSDNSIRLCHPHLSGFAFEYMMAYASCSRSGTLLLSKRLVDGLTEYFGPGAVFFGHWIFESESALIRLYHRPVGSRTLVTIYPVPEYRPFGGNGYIEERGQEGHLPQSLRRLKDNQLVGDFDLAYGMDDDRWKHPWP